MKTSKSFILMTVFFLFLGLNISLSYYLNSVKNTEINFLKSTITQEAKTLFNTITTFRQWNSNFDGVYVKQQEGLEPNPYLAQNHLYSKQNEHLIKINHAWMTRQLSELSNSMNRYRFRMTSLQPINPKNKAINFEKTSLQYFVTHKNEPYYVNLKEDFSQFNFMGALKSSASCLQCHVTQDYRVGDVVGGISIEFPLEEYQRKYYAILNHYKTSQLSILMVSLILFLGIAYIIHLVSRKNEQVKKHLKSLEKLTQTNETLMKRYKYAVEGSQSGVWDWNLQNDQIYFDKNWKLMLGYEEHEVNNDLEEWGSRVHPDDKEKAIQDILNNQNKKTDYYLNIHRMRHKNGSWVWILDRGKTYFDTEGNGVRMVGFHTDITPFKELELELFEKEQNLMNAQQIAHMGHWRYNATNDFFVASDAVYELIGIGSNLKIDSYKDFVQYIHEDDVTYYMDQHHKVIKNRSKKSIQYRIIYQQTQEVRYIEEHISFVQNDKLNEESFIGTMQDITQSKQTEHELKLFKKIIDDSPLVIMITNKDNHLMYVNKYFSYISGYKPNEVMGKNPRFLKSGETSAEEYKDMWQILSSKKTWGGTFRNLTKKGNDFWVTSMIIPILDENDEIINYLAIKREITKELYLEKELKEKEDLMLMQSKNAAMGEMISMIAHQWRQPITTISMMANNILADIELEMFEEKTAKEFAIELGKQTQYLSQTIEDFRNFFKQDKVPEETTFEEIFDDVNSIIAASLKNNNIDFITQYDENISFKTYRREVEQILINLIKNAKEAFDGSNIQDKCIKIEIMEEEHSIIVKISDNAGGIKQENMERIFEAYFTTKEGQNGTGLGLYMSKMIAQKHLQGDLLASNIDKGTMFRLSLQKFVE